MPGSRIARVRRQPGLLAATAVVAVTGTMALVGVAGAAEDTTVVGKTDTLTFVDNDITVDTGDTVTWTFEPGSAHNAANDTEETSTGGDLARWEDFNTVDPDADPPREYNDPGSFTFTSAGTYYYVCSVHQDTMVGVVRVEGEDVEPTPTEEPTTTATPTTSPDPQPTTSPTPTATPPPDDHTQTPAPGGTASTDKTAPTLSRVRLKGRRRVARVSFRLDETATVTMRFKKRGSKKVLRRARVQARAGRHTVRVRSAKFKRGRYKVDLRAQDAMGNRSSIKRASMKVRR